MLTFSALDVYTEEPPKSEILKKIVTHAKVVATPHLGASTSEAQIRVATGMYIGSVNKHSSFWGAEYS